MKPNLNPGTMAEALYKVSEQNNILQEVESALAFLNNIVSSNGQFRVFVQSKKIKGNQKAKILNIVLGDSGHPLVNEMISYLFGSNAPNILRETYRLFQSKYRKGSNYLEVKGIVAHELSESQIDSLKKSLDSLLGKQTKLFIKVDTALIGGIKLRIENTFLDASIQNQLQILRTELLHI